MELKSLKEMKEEFNRTGTPQAMTHLDRMRQALTNAIAQRIHKHIKPHPHAIDEDDIIVEREGWITEDELRAAAYVIASNDNLIEAPEYDLARAYRSEAQKRNAI